MPPRVGPVTRPAPCPSSSIRNVAIIAHVDHGKTTLVDGLLKQAGTFRTGEVVAERAMDSNDLERERGITILSKCTAVTWKGVRINIVDTPGHADFGGEVERVLGMVDSVLLLVDAYEGAMPQTRFVTQKAFEMGLSPIVVVNKIDRPGVDPHDVMDQVFELFDLARRDRQAARLPGDLRVGPPGLRDPRARRRRRRISAPMLDLIVEKVPPAAGDPDAPLLMQVATLDYDDYLGYMAIGRMRAGRSKVGDRVLLAHRDGKKEEFRVQKVLGFQGLKRFELAEARRRRHRRVHRHGRAQRRRDDHVDPEPDDPAAAQGRRADDHDELPRQRRPVRRHAKASTSRRATCASGSSARSRATSRCGSRRPTTPACSRCRAAASCTSPC